MNYLGKFISNISQAYSEINPATLTGAIDVIIVEQEDGSYLCSPFHVRFGKMGVIRSKEKIVDIEVNGVSVDIHMKLGDSGEAYFLEECEDDDHDNDETSLTKVQSGNKADADDAAKSNDKSSDDAQVPTDRDKNQLRDKENLQPNGEARPHDSDSVTPVNGSCPDKAATQKRVRRKKKNRAVSKQSSQTDTKTDPVESGVEPERESEDATSGRAPENEILGHQYTDDEVHPYSDSEVSHSRHSSQHKYHKKHDSMSGEPYDCKSDSEYEMFKSNNNDKPHNHDNISWDWGELPNVQKETSNNNSSNINNKIESENKSKSPRSSVLGGMLGFIIKDKDQPSEDKEDKGIYLDDLDPNDMNPEVAAKYFPKFANRSSFSHRPSNGSDEDIESGTGPSLSNSPHSVEFNYPQGDFGEFDDKNIASYDFATICKVYHDMSMSLCGGIENLFSNPSDSERFLQSIISFDDFSENPLQILNDPNLVIRMGGKYYTWKMASSIILSLLMFQRPLPEKALDVLKEQCIPKKKITAQNSTSSWRSWFRSNPTEQQSQDGVNYLTDQSVGLESRSISSISSGENLRGGANPSRMQSTPLEYTSDEETINIVLASNKSTSDPDNTNPSANTSANKKVKYRKVLRLKSEVIKSLNLKHNSNEVMFSVTTAFQGTSICRSKIFLWHYDDKIVISDIDGTITKSDVLGHILPYIGKDWAQLGVAQLYSNIEKNGYKFLYLSARAIGQAKVTRDYLRDLRQEDIGLPDGPLLLSPTSLFSALHREVIEKKPEEFKISCLKDIQTLFPLNPFFAGFGNKINDNWAYKAVGIDSSRIFTINPKGELKLERILSFKSTYTDLSQFVDQMFPPLQQHALYDGFSTFMFWRPDIPELDDKEVIAKD